mmetsp:Transcript_1362/g.5486  ORF Transcript_1362/g.5486 Transcript_1362/m.5486 type:complete len:235 (-) Transcript_1362:2520-3224(-)
MATTEDSPAETTPAPAAWPAAIDEAPPLGPVLPEASARPSSWPFAGTGAGGPGSRVLCSTQRSIPWAYSGENAATMEAKSSSKSSQNICPNGKVFGAEATMAPAATGAAAAAVRSRGAIPPLTPSLPSKPSSRTRAGLLQMPSGPLGAKKSKVRCVMSTTVRASCVKRFGITAYFCWKADECCTKICRCSEPLAAPPLPPEAGCEPLKSVGNPLNHSRKRFLSMMGSLWTPLSK